MSIHPKPVWALAGMLLMSVAHGAASDATCGVQESTFALLTKENPSVPAGGIETYAEPAWTIASPKDGDSESAQKETWALLMADTPALKRASRISVSLSASEQRAIGAIECEDCEPLEADPRRLQVGVVKTTAHPISVDAVVKNRVATGSTIDLAGGYAWATQVVSDGATALRVHFKNVDLPDSAALFVYNEVGEVFGPYTDRGPNGTGEFWSNTVTGEQIFVQLRILEARNLKNASAKGFEIGGVVHLGLRFLIPKFLRPTASEKAFCSFNAPCVEDGSCFNSGDWGAINSVRNGVAHIQFVSGGGSFICSGGLLNDTDSTTQVPLFLTANHCISTSSEANSLEAYWRFRTSSCGGSCFSARGNVPRTLGATLLRSSSSSDYSLMQLSQSPPSGSTFLGWTTANAANTNNLELYRLSHPKGAPQAYSKHRVTTSAGTCGSIPRGRFIYSRDIEGATEGGSSGSPVLTASGQVVGQLFGACGSSPSEACNSADNATVDGALASYFSSVSQWLDPDTGGGGGPGAETMSVSSIQLNLSRWWSYYRANATVTVVDENGAPVSGARVTGNFRGDFRSTRSGTTNSQGRVTIRSAWRWRATDAEFCVTGITHPSLTYDSSSNAETCETN